MASCTGGCAPRRHWPTSSSRRRPQPRACAMGAWSQSGRGAGRWIRRHRTRFPGPRQGNSSLACTAHPPRSADRATTPPACRARGFRLRCSTPSPGSRRPLMPRSSTSGPPTELGKPSWVRPEVCRPGRSRPGAASPADRGGSSMATSISASSSAVVGPELAAHRHRLAGVGRPHLGSGPPRDVDAGRRHRTPGLGRAHQLLRPGRWPSRGQRRSLAGAGADRESGRRAGCASALARAGRTGAPLDDIGEAFVAACARIAQR